MTREEKVQIVNDLTEKLSNTSYFYITDASGLSVAEVNAFRKECFDNDVEYTVIKNTLIKKALDNLEGDYSELDQALKGFSGVMFSAESGSAPAKVLKKYRGKDNEKPVLKGASIESAIYIGDDKLTELSKIKSKQELIGEVISLLQSPAKNVISALSSGKDTLGGIVKTLSEREA